MIDRKALGRRLLTAKVGSIRSSSFRCRSNMIGEIHRLAEAALEGKIAPFRP